jgi:hypothetical protein
MLGEKYGSIEMGPENQSAPMTEDFLLYIMSLVARQRGSRVFFKVSHNMSLDRGWHFWCAPDMDLVEVRPDDTVVAYEVKGQQRRKGSYEWPAIHDGMDQALRYLTLPRVTSETTEQGMFEGGVPDLVYLVDPIPSRDVLAPLDVRVISLTPVGFMGIQPLSVSLSMQSGEVGAGDIFTGQLDKIVELVPARQNPLQDSQAKAFFLEHLASLKNFGEESRIFSRRVKRAALEYLEFGRRTFSPIHKPQ